jgi:hydrogenase maturation protease
MRPFPRTILVGLGNPLLADDGAGWRVVELVETILLNSQAAFPKSLTATCTGIVLPTVDIEFLAGGGLSLMEHLVGYDRAILVDAIQTGQQPVGSVQVFNLEALENPASGHLGSSHETNLQSALEIGHALGAHLPGPGAVTIVAIEALTVFDFSEQLTPAVAQALEIAAQKVLELLQ